MQPKNRLARNLIKRFEAVGADIRGGLWGGDEPCLGVFAGTPAAAFWLGAKVGLPYGTVEHVRLPGQAPLSVWLVFRAARVSACISSDR